MFDNSKRVIRIRKTIYIMAISITVLIPIITVPDIFEHPLYGIPREAIASVLAAIYLIASTYRFYLNFNFIQYSFEDNKFILKYFSLRPFATQRHTIEIPLSAFAGYKMQHSFFKRKQALVLLQRIKGKQAAYPAVSLTAMRKAEIEQLCKILETLKTGTK